MERFYLILNPLKDGAVEMAEKIRKYLREHGCQCLIQGEEAGEMEDCRDMPREEAGETKDSRNMSREEAGETQDSQDMPKEKDGRKEGYRYTDSCQVPEDTQCVITLGGDGTLIQAARDLAGRRIPMLGVNLGNLGYLTQVGRQEEMAGLLDDLMSDQYRLERRMMLKGIVLRKGTVIKEDLALNEVVIARREMLQLLKLRVFVNGEPLHQYQADGMIVATPTGSTAYNLSAGGPIVEPTASMTILTPICSHALNGRSIVLSSEDRIEIEVLGNQEKGQAAVFDGDTFVHLKVGDRLRIERSETETILVKLRAGSFLDNLRSKLAGI